MNFESNSESLDGGVGGLGCFCRFFFFFFSEWLRNNQVTLEEGQLLLTLSGDRIEADELCE